MHKYLENTADNTREQNATAMWAKISAALDAEVQAGKKAASQQKGGAPASGMPTSRALLISGIDPSVTDWLLKDVHWGKGSPAACGVFIVLAVRYGLADPRQIGDFTDKYMGVDCSGFVSNYLVQIGKVNAHNVRDHGNAASYDQTPTDRRSSLDAVRRYDLMVWVDTAHIAVIDSDPVSAVASDKALPAAAAASPAYTCDVVESNGARGLDTEFYTLLSVDKNNVFTVQRASEKKTWRVHIRNYGIG